MSCQQDLNIKEQLIPEKKCIKRKEIPQETKIDTCLIRKRKEQFLKTKYLDYKSMNHKI